jgi:putative hydrolase of the HAD superfamily
MNWQALDDVLLDLDGTLLDLRFDNHFWLEHVPLRFAEQHGLPLEVARAELLAHYQAVEGTLNWYCVDYWSQRLSLDIMRLKEEVAELIAMHAYTQGFLTALRGMGKRVLLVTNAHGKSLALKFSRLPLHDYFDAVITSHDYGAPKETAAFWQRLQLEHAVNLQRALLVDDSLAVLRAARASGVGYLVAVRAPDSRHPPRQIDEFYAVDSLLQLFARST